jgi:hypothetical protein
MGRYVSMKLEVLTGVTGGIYWVGVIYIYKFVRDDMMLNPRAFFTYVFVMFLLLHILLYKLAYYSVKHNLLRRSETQGLCKGLLFLQNQCC